MDYPTAPDKKIQKLSNLLIRYAESEGVEFSFGEEPVSAGETFGYFGALSLFVSEAKEQYEKVFNKLYTVEELMSSFSTEKNQKSKPKITEQQKVEEENYLNNQPRNKLFPIDFFEQEEDTYFGFIPRLSQEVPGDFIAMAHLTHYALEEYIQMYKKNKMLLINGKIPLDPLYDKMVTKINNKQLRIRPASQLKSDLDIKNQKDNVSEN